VLTMRKLIDANRTQAALDWSQIDWRKIEKTVLRLQHRIFMAMYGLAERGNFQRSLQSSRMRREAHVRFLGGSPPRGGPLPATGSLNSSGLAFLAPRALQVADSRAEVIAHPLLPRAARGAVVFLHDRPGWGGLSYWRPSNDRITESLSRI
jgi:hypothetical protein